MYACVLMTRTVWTDIDYMNRRRVFSIDQHRFPARQMQKLMKYLRDRRQHFIAMVDPAVAQANYSAFDRGSELDVFVKESRSELFRGVVWPVSPELLRRGELTRCLGRDRLSRLVPSQGHSVLD